MKVRILIISTVQWSFLWQRPQQIVSRLVKDGHSILYLQNPTYLNRGTLVWTLNCRNLFIRRKITGQLNVLNMFLPPFGGKLKFVSDKLAVWIFKLYLRFLRFRPEVAIFYSVRPIDLLLLGTLKSMGTKIVYDCYDEVSGFSGAARMRVLQEEKDLVTKSSVVIATSNVLCKKLSKLNPNCVYIPNGADTTHFLEGAKTSEKIPEIEHFRHPIVGYIGAIYDWVDAELLCRLAELHPEYSILLLGPLDYGRELECGLEKFKRHANITLLGERKYEVLPKYLSYMDVCLIPFKINKLTIAANPIKLYEYLAAGKPVVSTALPEVVDNASELVYIGKNREDFIRKVEEAVEELKRPEHKAIVARRVRFAEDNSWERRIAVLESLIRQMLKSH